MRAISDHTGRLWADPAVRRHRRVWPRALARGATTEDSAGRSTLLGRFCGPPRDSRTRAGPLTWRTAASNADPRRGHVLYCLRGPSVPPSRLIGRGRLGRGDSPERLDGGAPPRHPAAARALRGRRGADARHEEARARRRIGPSAAARHDRPVGRSGPPHRPARCRAVSCARRGAPGTKECVRR